MNRGLQLGVQHHFLDASGVLKGRPDGRIGVDRRFAIHHLRRRINRRRAPDRLYLLDAAHRVQRKADANCIIDPAHLLRGQMPQILQCPAFVDGEDLLCLHNRRHIQPCVFQQAVGRLIYFLFRLACHGRNDQGRRVIIAHVILKNDRRAVTVLFRAGARPEMGEEDVSALEFPVLLQNCTSMLLCAKPAAGCSATSFVQGMVVWLGQRCMTT